MANELDVVDGPRHEITRRVPLEEGGPHTLQMRIDPLAQVVGDHDTDAPDHAAGNDDERIAGGDAGEDCQGGREQRRFRECPVERLFDPIDAVAQVDRYQGLEDACDQQAAHAKPECEGVTVVIGKESCER